MGAKENKEVVILGMHRSGTSMFSNWIHNCGLHIGQNLMGEGIGNDLGHFEDIDFHDLHESIFRKQNIPYGGLNKLSRLDYSSIDQNQFSKIIAQKNNSNPKVWGWKDPRTCLFINEYLKVVENSGVFIVIFRDYQSVVSSLLRRQQKLANQASFLSKVKTLAMKMVKGEDELLITPNSALTAWCVYNEKLLEFIDKGVDNTYIIDLDFLNAHDKSFISQLNNQGLQLNYVPFDTVYKKDMYKSQNRADYQFDDSLKERANLIVDQFRKYQK